MPEHKLRCGDHVRHRPSGEDWSVSFADYTTGYMSWFGWPDGEARIEDCDLVEACSDEEHEKAVDQWLTSPGFARGDRRPYNVAWLYRPAALIPGAEQSVKDAEANLERARVHLAELQKRAGLVTHSEKANDYA